METVTISTHVTVLPSVLSASLPDTVRSVVHERYAGKCTETDGIILQVHDPVRIVNNIVERDNMHIRLYVRFQVDRVLPRTGMEVDAQVVKAIPNGLFFTYHGLNILVTKATLKGQYVAPQGKEAYFSVDGRGDIHSGTTHRVRLTRVQWCPPVVKPTAVVPASRPVAPQGMFTVIGELV